MRNLVLSLFLISGLIACSEDSSPEIEEASSSAVSEITESVTEISESAADSVTELSESAAEILDSAADDAVTLVNGAVSTINEQASDLVATMQGNPTVLMETSMGNITIELWADKAPLSVENFLSYTDAGFYDGLIFHRVIPGFMVQGGGFDQDMVQKSNYDPIKNEAKADVPNSRATLAMARTNVVDSATSQFFINLVDNDFLNHTDESARGFGYAVFGEVIEGMDTVDAIAQVNTGQVRGFSDVPTETVTINSVTRAN